MIGTVYHLLNRLEECGYEAYLVGGCVRDLYLGREPEDYDIATSATPQEIKGVFQSYKMLFHGEKYGTISVRWEGMFFEITTYRIDGTYSDCRRPTQVTFTKDLTEDLSRRDFTMNAMAMNKEGEIFDPFHGLGDLSENLLVAVGEPALRIQEDALRIMRAFRFATKFSLNMEEELFEAVTLEREKLREISVERIFQEFSKLLLCDRPSFGLRMMAETGVLHLLFPELARTIGFDQKTPYHVRTLFDHLLCVVDHVPSNLAVRLAALFHDVAKVDTLSIGEDGRGHFFGHEIQGVHVVEKVLKRFHVANQLIEKVQILISDHMKVHAEMTDKALRRQIKRVGRENILDLYDLMIGDCLCTSINRDASFIQMRKERVQMLLEENIMQKEHFLSINGEDIMQLGIPQGKMVGTILKELKEIVLDDPSKNTQEILLQYVREHYPVAEQGK